MERGVGDAFQQETKYFRGKMQGAIADGSKAPGLYKEYVDTASISLPSPSPAKGLSLDETLRKRKSVRSYVERPLNKQQLAYLLWSSNGVQRVEEEREFRTAPSAGALYPIETYLVVNNVDEIPRGVYHYSVRSNALEELRSGDFGQAAARAALGQRMCSQAPVVFIWTAIFQRTKWRYRERAYRYIYLDAGHIAENLALSAVSLGLGSCQIGALYDEEVNEIIGVDGIEESTIYMTVVGWPS